jgi:type IV pilus assembly protein PilZ
MSHQNERRQDSRAPIELKVEYKRLNTFFYDFARNISKGGTFIKTSKPLPVGTVFIFKLFVPSLSEPLVLRGEVRWSRREEDLAEDPGQEGEAGMGIRLVYEDEEERRSVERAVEKLMVESLGPRIYAHLRSSGTPETD